MSKHGPASANLSENTQILLAWRPTGEPTLANFRIVQTEVPRPERGDVLLRTLFLSLDPYMRARMNAGGSYAAPVEVGAVMTGGTVAEVVESRHGNFAAGDVVLAHTGWQTFGVQAGAELRKLNSAVAPYSTALGVLGMPGFTAYAGLKEIGRPAAGETVVVAAASGPVGSTVGQLARMAGARVVGIVGGLPCASVRRSLSCACAAGIASINAIDALDIQPSAFVAMLMSASFSYDSTPVCLIARRL